MGLSPHRPRRPRRIHKGSKLQAEGYVPPLQRQRHPFSAPRLLPLAELQKAPAPWRLIEAQARLASEVAFEAVENMDVFVRAWLLVGLRDGYDPAFD